MPRAYFSGMTRPRRYRLVDADTPKRARLAWAIQVSFLELLSQFPSEKDFLQRCYNRYDKRGVTGEGTGSGSLIRIRFGQSPLHDVRRCRYRRSTLGIDSSRGKRRPVDFQAMTDAAYGDRRGWHGPFRLVRAIIAARRRTLPSNQVIHRPLAVSREGAKPLRCIAQIHAKRALAQPSSDCCIAVPYGGVVCGELATSPHGSESTSPLKRNSRGCVSSRSM